MTISFDARLSVPSDVLVSNLGGESVLLSLNRECYYGLDAMGTRMWTALTTAESIQSAYDGLLAEYDVTEEKLRNDMCDLIEKLVDQGLVAVAGR